MSFSSQTEGKSEETINIHGAGEGRHRLAARPSRDGPSEIELLPLDRLSCRRKKRKWAMAPILTCND